MGALVGAGAKPLKRKRKARPKADYCGNQGVSRGPPHSGVRGACDEGLAHGLHRGNLARFASVLQVLIEALVDACLPNHEQGCHVQGLGHGDPTALD